MLDQRGRSTGVVRSRATIHQDGAWHLAFHCWVFRPGASAPEVVLQRRAFAKDTFPGLWDASAAGHWRHGEVPMEAAREVEEELGIHVPFGQMLAAGRERIARKHPNGLIDREFHQVYVVCWPAALVDYRPDPREVAGLAAVRITDLIAVVEGQRSAADATEACAVGPEGDLSTISVSLSRTQLVSYSSARLRRVGRAGMKACARRLLE